MISDVLSDALAEVEDYQKEMPDAYAENAAEIGVVKTVMEALRIVLDASPGLGDEHDKLIAELRSALRAVAVSGIHGVRDRLLAWVVEERERLKKEKGA